MGNTHNNQTSPWGPKKRWGLVKITTPGLAGTPFMVLMLRQQKDFIDWCVITQYLRFLGIQTILIGCVLDLW